MTDERLRKGLRTAANSARHPRHSPARSRPSRAARIRRLRARVAGATSVPAIACGFRYGAATSFTPS